MRTARTHWMRWGLVAAAGTVMLSAAPAQAVPSAPSSEVSIGSVRASLDYLMSTYGVTQDEAMRRLRLQAQAADLADQVTKAVGDELLDVWLDQDGGGKLTFLTSEPQEATTALGVKYDTAQIKIVQTLHTAAQLEKAATDIRARLGTLADRDVEIGVDRHNQRVVVDYVGTDPSRGTQIHAAAGMVSSGGTAVVVTEHPKPAHGQGERSCSTFACDAPMRGGLRLHTQRQNGTWGSCTAGFNVRGSNGWVYVLTAGHCVILPGSNRQYFYHNGLPAVWEKSQTNDTDPTSSPDLRYSNNDYPRYDWAMLPYQTNGVNWSGYWLNNRGSHNLVQSQCMGPSNNSCSSGAYVLSGMYTWTQMQVGWVVCATGTGTSVVYPSTNYGYLPGTRCGHIMSKSVAQHDYYNTNSCCGFGIQVDICSRDGDSGGPLWSQIDGKAYGILSGGPANNGDGKGPCNMSNVHEYSVYSPLSQILDNAHNQTGITFSLITSPTG